MLFEDFYFSSIFNFFCYTGCVLKEMEGILLWRDYKSQHVLIARDRRREAWLPNEHILSLLEEVVVSAALILWTSYQRPYHDAFVFAPKDVVERKFVPPGQTISAVYYVYVPEKLRKRVIRVRKVVAANRVFHYDNAPSFAPPCASDKSQLSNAATAP